MRFTRGFWFESPENSREVWISFAEVEELALEDGLTQSAENMDDDLFFSYCERICGI